MPDRRVAYTAGPMRGIEHYNFNAFEQFVVALRTKHKTWKIHSPHEIDIRSGGVEAQYKWQTRPNQPAYRLFTDVRWVDGGKTTAGTEEAFQVAIRRDIRVLTECNSIFFMRGFENSTGARIEAQVGEWIGLEPFLQNGLDVEPTTWDEVRRRIYDATEPEVTSD